MKRSEDKKEYNEKYLKSYRNKEAKLKRQYEKARDLNIRLKEIDRLFEYLTKELEIDLLNPLQNQSIVKYRSLFNSLVTKKLKIRNCDLIRFYENKGRFFTSAIIVHSLKMFDTYKKTYPEINILYNSLYNETTNLPTINIDKRELTPIQKLVEDLTPCQAEELTELITLRKKSWEWKSKDSIKVYQGSY